MRLASMPLTIAALSFGLLAACTANVDDPATSNGESSLGRTQARDSCGAWQAWEAAPPVTGIVAGIYHRKYGAGGGYPDCPVVFVNGVANVPYDAGQAIYEESRAECRALGTTCVATPDILRAEWGWLYTSYSQLNAKYCGYNATPSTDAATYAANTAALAAAVKAQVPAVAVPTILWTVGFSDIRAPILPMVCNRPGGHGCTSCQSDSTN